MVRCKHIAIAVLQLQLHQVCLCHDGRDSDLEGLVGSRPRIEARLSNSTAFPKRQNTGTEMSNCGYFTGDPDKPRTSDRGFNCRFDTRNGLWGFCPTTVISAIDCGLAGCCVDGEDCKDGCGKTGQRTLTTFTCQGSQVCSTALVEFGVDQTYSYIACGASARTDIYLATAVTTRDYQTSSEIDESTSSSISSMSSSRPASATEAATSTADNETQQTPEPSSPSPTEEATRPRSAQETEQATTTESASSPDNNGGVPIGPVVGGVIGGLLIICATIVAVVYIRRSNRRKTQASPNLPASNETQGCGRHNKPEAGQESASGSHNVYELSGNHRWLGNRELAELGT